MNKVNICGINFNNITMEHSLAVIEELIRTKKQATVFHPNVDCVCIANDDKDLMRIYNKSDLVLADGMAIIWASKLLRKPLKEKISGPDLLPRICAMASEKNYNIFFLGGREGVAKKACEVFKGKYKKLRIAGFYHGYFDKAGDENRWVISKIANEKPDILVVAFGTPLQEKWIEKNMEELEANLCIGVGAAIDFHAGTIPRAPRWIQNIGFEWLFRLFIEPKRLWRRYLVRDLKFFHLLLLELIGNKKNNI